MAELDGQQCDQEREDKCGDGWQTLYAVRQPELRAELARRFETTRQQLAASLEPHRAGHDKPTLTAIELAVIAVAASYGLGVQPVLDHTAIPPDLYQRMMAKLLD